MIKPVLAEVLNDVIDGGDSNLISTLKLTTESSHQTVHHTSDINVRHDDVTKNADNLLSALCDCLMFLFSYSKIWICSEHKCKNIADKRGSSDGNFNARPSRRYKLLTILRMLRMIKMI